MRWPTLIAVVLVALPLPAARSGEALAPEALLPAHEGRDAYWPGAAFGKDAYLVTWQSGRIAEGDLRDGPKFIGDIVGCRLDKSGKALDAQPFVICKAPDMQERPKVASDGNVFLVVWQDLRSVKDWDIYAARVTPEGKVLDPDGILVAGGPRSQCLPRVVWDGKTFVVVWQDLRSNKWYEVRAARVASDGKVLDPQGISVAANPDCHRYSPALASVGGGKSLVLWNSNRFGNGWGMMSGWTLLADGAAKKTETWDYKTPSWQELPTKGCVPMCAAAGPNAYLAAWTTQIPGGRGNASENGNATVFDAEGKRLVLQMTLSGKPQRIIAPEAAWDGSGFVAAWAEQNKPEGNKFPHDALKAARISAEGKPSGNVLEVSGTPESPAKSVAVASDGAGTSLIAYEKHPEKADAPIRIGYRILTAK